ncbi:MAG: hypothetical protein ACREVV_11270 [Steroidobacteraceae bacterium]
MSRRDSFWFLAGALVTVAVFVTTRGIVAQHPYRSAAGMSAAMPSARADSAGSLDDVTRKLAARLAASGGSADEWRLLAQSYTYMGRPAEAQAAEAHLATADQSTNSHAEPSPGDAVAARWTTGQ